MAFANTKDHILCCAREEFGRKGFHGVAVRDLAALAEVNISAINYHFGSKECLFNEVLKQSYQQIDLLIAQLCPAGCELSFPELALRIFDLFIEHRQSMLSVFRILLGDRTHFNSEAQQLCEAGPPGGDVLRRSLQRIHPDVSEEQLAWGVRSLFVLCLHSALFFELNGCHNANSSWSYKQLQFEIELQVNAILGQLKT